MQKRIPIVLALMVGWLFSVQMLFAQKVDVAFGDEGNGFQRISFDLNHDAKKMLQANDGGFLILADLGRFDSIGYDQDWAVIKTDSNGQLDSSFGNNGVYVADFQSVDYCFSRDFALDQNGNIFVLGTGHQRSGSAKTPTCVVKLLPNGTPDSTYGNNGSTELFVEGYQDYPNDLLADDSGRVWVAGGADDSTKTVSSAYVIRLDADGAPDAGWGVNGIFTKNVKGHFNGSSRHSTGQEYFGIYLEKTTQTLYAVGSNSYYQGVVSRFNVVSGIDSTFGDSGHIAFDHPQNQAHYFNSVESFGDELILQIVLYSANSRDFEYASLNLTTETFVHHRIANADDDVFGSFIPRDSNLYIIGRNIFSFNIHPAYYADQFMLSKIQEDYSLDLPFGDEGNYFFEYNGANTKNAGGVCGFFINDSCMMVLGNEIDSSAFSHILLCKLRIPFSNVSQDTTDTLSVAGQNDNIPSFSVFPNPVRRHQPFQWKLNEGQALSVSRLRVSDVSGRTVKWINVHNRRSAQISSGISVPGVYFLEAFTGQQPSGIRTKLVVW